MEESKGYSVQYKKLHHKLRNALYGVGDIGTQHIIAVSSVLGMLPRHYVCSATICHNTTAANKLMLYVGLAFAATDKILQDVAKELDILPMFVENMLCEFLRDNEIRDKFMPELYEENIKKRDVIHPDSFIKGQHLYTLSVDKDERGKYIVDVIDLTIKDEITRGEKKRLTHCS